MGSSTPSETLLVDSTAASPMGGDEVDAIRPTSMAAQLSRIPPWVLLSLFWVGMGWVSTALVAGIWPEKDPLWKIYLMQAPPWLCWAVMSPVVIRVARAFPFEPRRLWVSIPVHVVTFLVTGVIVLTAATLACNLSGDCRPPEFGARFLRYFTYYFELTTAVYLVVAVGTHALDYHRKFRDTELGAARLQAQLAQAQLDTLKMQLHPHFLFNTLNAVATLVRKGEAQPAIRMLAGVSDLLRIALENEGHQTVPLKQELDFLDRYLEVERTRFGDRLQVRKDIAAETLDAEVPNLVLQPLAENAIRHGIERSSDAGAIEVSARREGDRVVITLRNDGPGLVHAATRGYGVGMGNVRARLEQLYPGRHRLLLEDVPGGVRVTVEIPYLAHATARG